MEIVGLGTLAMDILTQVDTLPLEDGFSIVEKTSFLPGGSGTNVIVQAARLSAECGYIAQTGDDEIGKNIRESLISEKVDIRAMPVKKGGVSLSTNVVVDRSGKKFILLNMGDALMSLNVSSVDINYLLSAKIFYTDLLPVEPAVYALRRAKESGLKTAFNMQVDLRQMESLGITREKILEALRHLDVFAPCREGFRQLTGTDDLKDGNALIRRYFDGILLLTQGGSGSVAFDNNNSMVLMPVFDVKTVDTTGAGDSYMGAFLYSYLLKNAELKDAMYFSTACASITCMGVGARSMPTLSQAEAFLQTHKMQSVNSGAGASAV